MPIETAPFVADLVPTNPTNSDPVQQGADHLRLIKQTLVDTFPNIDAAVTATPTQINSWEGRIVTALRGAPVGTIYQWLTGTPPTDHLLLNGGTHLRADYPALWALWGPSGSNILGVGDGLTTFVMPDVRLRFAVMAGTGLALGATGGSQTPTVSVTAAGAHTHTALTAGGHAHTNQSVGAHTHGGSTGGHALTVGQLPSHNHGVNDPGHQHDLSSNIYSSAGASLIHQLSGPGGALLYAGNGQLTSVVGTGITIQSTGSNETHSHTISADGGHTHTMDVQGAHTHTTDDPGNHTHTATIADGRPPFFAFNFIVRAR